MGVRTLRSRARKVESPSGRFIISTRRVKDGFKQVDDLRVEGTPIDTGLLNKSFVQVSWHAERDPLLEVHAKMMP